MTKKVWTECREVTVMEPMVVPVHEDHLICPPQYWRYYCSNCGEEIEVWYKACSYCGAIVGGAETKKREQRKENYPAK